MCGVPRATCAARGQHAARDSTSHDGTSHSTSHVHVAQSTFSHVAPLHVARSTCHASAVLRNSVGWRDRLARLRGSSVLLDLQSLRRGARRDRRARCGDGHPDRAGAARSRRARARRRGGRPAAGGAASRALRAGSRAVAPPPRHAALRRADRRRSRHGRGRDRRDADRRGQDAGGGDAGGAQRAGRPRRPRPHLQRLPGAARRRVDGAGLSGARALRGVRAAGHGACGPAAGLSRGCDLRDGEGGGLRLPARSPGPERLRTGAPALPHGAGGRSGLHPDRRGPRAARGRRRGEHTAIRSRSGSPS